MKRIFAHLFLWIGILVFWIAISRNNHPNLLLNVIASFTLVSASAIAIYVSRLVLKNRYAKHRNKIRYITEIILLVAALDLAAVLIIQTVYDALWGPDPARFGFLTNVALEAAFIGLHLALAYGLVNGWRAFRQKAA